MLEAEQQLIQEAKRGSSESFGTLYDHYMPQIYRFVYLKTGFKETAEDLTHEVFVNAWQRIPLYEEKGFPLSSWLYQIARNAVIDHFRTLKKNIPIDVYLEDELGETEETEDDIDQSIALETIQTAMRELSDEHQTVLIMRFVEELPSATIALTLGKSEGAIRLVQHRALKRLKTIVQNNAQHKT